MYGKGLRPLSTATVVAIAASFSLVFFYAPLDADQGFIQKIFYLHVPLAITALAASSSAASSRSPTCAAATASGTPTPTSRSTCR